MRRPGAAGVKVTGCMQISGPGKATGTTQLNAPSAWKSRLGAPSVSTSTLFTAPLPDAVKVTVTVCGPEATPTGCGVAKMPCAQALAPASSKAAKAAAHLRAAFHRKCCRETATAVAAGLGFRRDSDRGC